MIPVVHPVVGFGVQNGGDTGTLCEKAKVLHMKFHRGLVGMLRPHWLHGFLNAVMSET